GSRSGDPSGVSTGLGSTRHCSPNATWLRPAALARYSARSAATRTSSTAGPRPGANSATPILTVTSPAGTPPPHPPPHHPRRPSSPTPPPPPPPHSPPSPTTTP